MKSRVLLSVIAMAGLTSSVLAADLPSRRAPPVYAPPPPIPAFTWTGFYVGGDVGYAFGRDPVTLTVPAAGFATTYGVGSPRGIAGGGHVGYNFSTQSLPVLGPLAGAFGGLPVIGGFGGAGGVVGIEGDVRGEGYRATVAPIPAFIAGSLEQHRSDVQGTIRGRLGIAVDRALFFATGGAAFATFRNAYNDGLGDTGVLSTTRVGFVVGGGVEYALTNNFSLRAEYRYEDFGRYTQTFTPAALGGAAVNFSHRDTQNQVTAGFSYKFESPLAPPVVARY